MFEKDETYVNDKPCACVDPCGHYAWLDDKEYLAEDSTEPVVPDKIEGSAGDGKGMDLRKSKDDSLKHRIFMEGKCVKCKVEIKPLPEEIYTVVGLLEFPLHNFNACNGTLYHIECPKDQKPFAPSITMVDKSLLLD